MLGSHPSRTTGDQCDLVVYASHGEQDYNGQSEMRTRSTDRQAFMLY